MLSKNRLDRKEWNFTGKVNSQKHENGMTSYVSFYKEEVQLKLHTAWIQLV